MPTNRQVLLVMLALVASACTPSDRDRDGDSVEAGASSASRNPVVETAAGAVDSAATTTSGQDPDTKGVEAWRDLDPSRKPPKDMDHAFLRTMADNNEECVEMAFVAMDRGSTDTTKNVAKRLHEKHVRLRTEIVGMIQSKYGETLVPVVSDTHKQRMDSLHLAKNGEFDREFYRREIDHHREWIRRIDALTPRVKTSDVMAFAKRVRADLQADLDELTRRVGAS